jgi:hypothetical protein
MLYDFETTLGHKGHSLLESSSSTHKAVHQISLKKHSLNSKDAAPPLWLVAVPPARNGGGGFHVGTQERKGGHGGGGFHVGTQERKGGHESYVRQIIYGGKATEEKTSIKKAISFSATGILSS